MWIPPPCSQVSPNRRGMRLPWWGYCGTEMRDGFGMQGTNRRYPPGGGTRYYTDPVSRTTFKTCGNAGLNGWGGSPNFAVCCSGNTEGRSSMGSVVQLATTFQNPRDMVVGNAGYYWVATSQSRASLGRCNSAQWETNYGSRRYNQNVACRSLSLCPVGQSINLAIPRRPQDDRANNACRTTTVCSTSQRWLNARSDYNSSVLQYQTRLFDRLCEACPAGLSAVAPNSEDCCCVACGSGTYRLGTCTASRGCLASAQICVPVSTCGSGQYESTAPTPTSDRECQGCTSCPAGSWHPNVCAGHGDDCQSCRASCLANQFMKDSCTSTSDAVCAPLTACTPQQFMPIEATATSDRQCAPLTACAATEFTSVEATATSDRHCASLTTCGAFEFESVAATSTSDRVCAGRGVLLPPCGANEFEPVPVAPAAAERDCRSVTPDCGGNENEIAPPTATSDRRCANCHNCPAGEFESAGCTTTEPTECSPCDECGPGQVMVAPCRVRSNRECAAEVAEPAAIDEQNNTIASIRTVNGNVLINGKNTVQEINRLNSVIAEMERDLDAL